MNGKTNGKLYDIEKINELAILNPKKLASIAESSYENKTTRNCKTKPNTKNTKNKQRH